MDQPHLEEGNLAWYGNEGGWNLNREDRPVMDEFRGHSAAIVKEFCKSMSFFYPEIIPGGLTPVAQPLDKVINKVFKAYFRDLYDLCIITAPILPNGSPKPPPR